MLVGATTAAAAAVPSLPLHVSQDLPLITWAALAKPMIAVPAQRREECLRGSRVANPKATHNASVSTTTIGEDDGNDNDTTATSKSTPNNTNIN
jgi:hypothetical protein